MVKLMTARVGALVLVGATLFMAPGAQAEDAQAACIAAHESAQQQRQRGKLALAKQELERCSRDDCPTLIATDCAKWWAEVQAALPSVIVTAPSGAEVRIDGQVVAEVASGREQVLDPGEHVITATLEGHEPFERRITLAKGERGVEVTVVLAPSPEPAPPPAPGPVAPPAAPPPAEPTGPSAWTWVVGGIGLAGMGVFAGFAISGLMRRGDLDDLDCKPACPQEDVDAMSRDFLVADVALGVGLAGLVVATVLYLTTGDDGDTAAATGLARGHRGALLTF